MARPRVLRGDSVDGGRRVGPAATRTQAPVAGHGYGSHVPQPATGRSGRCAQQHAGGVCGAVGVADVGAWAPPARAGVPGPRGGRSATHDPALASSGAAWGDGDPAGDPPVGDQKVRASASRESVPEGASAPAIAHAPRVEGPARDCEPLAGPHVRGARLEQAGDPVEHPPGRGSREVGWTFRQLGDLTSDQPLSWSGRYLSASSLASVFHHDDPTRCVVVPATCGG